MAIYSVEYIDGWSNEMEYFLFSSEKNAINHAIANMKDEIKEKRNIYSDYHDSFDNVSKLIDSGKLKEALEAYNELANDLCIEDHFTFINVIGNELEDSDWKDDRNENDQLDKEQKEIYERYLEFEDIP